MSIKLMSLVWESNLPSHEKFIALALADYGSDDGTRIYPAIETVAGKVGKSERAVQYAIRSLEASGVLETVKEGGGRRNPTHYRMNIAALKGATSAPLPCHSAGETVQLTTETVQPTAPKPLEPSDPDPDQRVEIDLPGGDPPNPPRGSGTDPRPWTPLPLDI